MPAAMGAFTVGACHWPVEGKIPYTPYTGIVLTCNDVSQKYVPIPRLDRPSPSVTLHPYTPYITFREGEAILKHV